MSAPMWNVVTRRFFKKPCSSCGILSNFTPTQAILLRQSRSMTTISKMKTKFDESVKDVLETTSHRTHPGIVRPKAVMLPERLQRSIDVVLQSYTGRQLADKSQVLFNYLWSRKRPVEVNQLRKQAIVLAKQMGLEDEKRRYNDTELLEVKERNILKQKKKTVIMQLKKKLYHWKAIQYTKEMGLVYIASKMASNYSAIYRVLYEIQKREPEFKPKQVLDFGSGVGTAIWAANSIWGKSLREYFCVDISADMNDLAAVLLRDGKQDGRPCMKGVFFRQFLPVSPMNKFDVIISAYSLMDLPSVQERINTLRTLWIKTEHFLVVIENGTNEGYKTVLEARDLILHGENYLKTNRRIRKLDAEQDEDELNKESEQYSSNVDMKREFDKAVSMSMKMDDNWPVGHVYSPCSHDLPCPRLNDGTDTPCNYLQEYHPLKLSQMPKQVQKENFSYVVLRKGQRSKGCNEWPRLIRPVLVKSKHIHCHMCCHDGRIHHTVLTASKHGKDLYYCARYSKWGDQLPLSILAETMNKSTQENDSTQHKQCTEPTTEEDW